MRNYRTFFISSLIYFLTNTGVFAQLPVDYQRLTAEEKQDILWTQILKSHEEDPLPKLSGNSFSEILAKLKGLFNLKPSFDYTSDEIPAGRIKFIHANGSVGKIAFRPEAGHPFTGIYQTGAIGLARLSLATTPADDHYVPGMAVKFFIAHQPSVNLHVMQQLEGQNANWNYFANDFSNKIPHASGWVLRAIEKIFQWTRNPANELPLWHLAAWSSDGKLVLNPVSPERIYFRPSASVKNIIDENSREDFRLSFLQIPFGPIYDVYGLYQGTEYLMGSLMLESRLVASVYGDKTLFFQHQR